jgi:hypothetical protein
VSWISDTLSAHSKQPGEELFVVAFGHRPLYCSNGNKENCQIFSAILRGEVEELFYQHNVSLVLQAHQHDYERSYPIFKSTVTPNAPVYVLNGAAGNREGLTGGFVNPQPSYVAQRFKTFGFGKLDVFANSTMRYRFLSSERGAQVLDEFTMTSPFKQL